MKKSLLLASAAVFALCFAACQKEEKNAAEFTACMEQAGPQGKTYLDGEYINWNSGDQVAIYGSAASQCTYTVTPRTDDATWADLSPVDQSVGEGPYTAIYPAFFAWGHDAIEIPNTQWGDDGDLDAIPMYAAGSSTMLKFQHLCGVLRIRLQQEGVSIQAIGVTADRLLSGRYDIAVDDGVPVISRTAGSVHGSNTMYLEFEEPVSISEVRDFYIALPPSGSEGYSLQISFYDENNGKCVKTCSQPVVVERAKITGITLGSDLVFIPEGRLPGLFSVGNGHQVYFSQGNLQWTSTGTHAVDGNGTAAGTWRFAEHQYDYVGAPSQYATTTSSYVFYPGNVSGSDNAYISSSYTGWIDLFGWGTSGYHNSSDTYNTNYNPYCSSNAPSGNSYFSYNSCNFFGYGPSTNMSSPNLTGTSANYDWGVYNAISNGGNAPGQWRTLTNDEWYYLCNSRTDASSKYAIGHIDMGDGTYVNGCIFLPDSWTLPSDCSFTAGVSSNYDDYSLNTYTLAQWAQMEAAGALFLPAAGFRSGTGVSSVGYYGLYSSSSYDDIAYAYLLLFNGGRVCTTHGYRYYGQCVRLVQDVE